MSDSDIAKRIAGFSLEQRALLFQQLQQQNASAAGAPPPIVRQSRATRKFLTSFAQQRLWVPDQLEPGSPFYNVPEAYWVRGNLDPDVLRQTLELIVARHEALRTTFAAENGVPVQVVAEQGIVELPLVELRDHPAADRVAEALRIAHTEARLPFDLTRYPLMRALLLRLEQETHLLLLTMHHIISDGWSMGVLIQELAALYEALSAGKPSPLPPLPIQYVDFAIWQRQWLQGAVLEEQLAYWKRQLADLPMLRLATDYPRPQVQSHQGTTQSVMLPRQLAESLKALSQQEGCSLFITLAAAFDALLARYTGQEDIAIGTVIANRNRVEIEALIGFFVNTLVLRSDLAGDPPFRELLRRVREVALEAYAHQDLPFEKLIDELRPERDLGSTPFFQVLFVLQNTPLAPPVAGGLTISRQKISMGTAEFDLSMFVADHEQGLFVEVEYATDLFEAATITRLFGHYQALLEGIVADPDRRLSRLPLLTDVERQQLLVEWNVTPVEFRSQESGVRSTALCIHNLFEAQTARTPDALALFFAGQGDTETRRHGDKETRRQGDRETGSQESDDGERTTQNSTLNTQNYSPNTQHPTPNTQQLTYDELNRRANQLAHYLQRLGVGREVRVGICIERSLELIVGMLGVLKAGGAYVPLDPTYPQERLRLMVEDSQTTVLITTTRAIDKLTRLAMDGNEGRQADTETSRQGDKALQEPRTENQELRVTPSPLHPFTPSPLHTFTASQPAIVCLDRDWEAIAGKSAENPAGEVFADSLAYVIYTSGSTGTPKGVLVGHRGLGNVATSQIAAFDVTPGSRVLQFASFSFDATVSEVAMTLLSGATLCMMPHETLRSAPDLLGLLREQRITTATLTPSLLAVLPVEELPALQTLVAAGEACDAETVARWSPGRRFYNAYGPTETTICATIARCIDDGRRPPIGRPIACTQVYLLDEHQQPVPIGIPGELYIGGAGLARGYHARPELTAERFIPNPFGGVLGNGCWVTGAESSNTQHPTPNTRLYRTGDLARYRSDGAIEYLGRTDAQVKIRGFRIELGEIEAFLNTHPAVRTCAVLARQDQGGNYQLVAYVIPDQRPTTNDQGLTIDEMTDSERDEPSSFVVRRSSFVGELRSFMQEQLPEYMVPNVFMQLEALPLTAQGKIDRRALPAPEGLRPQLEHGYVAPRTPAEQLLTQLWADVLGLDRVGIHDNFFELGGNSILNFQIIARAHEAGIHFTPRQIFQYQTIADLAAVAEVREMQAEQGLITGTAPLMPLQREFLELSYVHRDHFRIAIFLEFPRALSVEQWESVVEHLVAQHDSLRQRFVRGETDSYMAYVDLGVRDVFSCVDLSTLDAAEQPAALNQLMLEQQTMFDMTKDPLFRAVLVERGPNQPDGLVLVVHYLVADVVSWQIVLEDLATAWEQVRQNEAIALPMKTTSAKQWAERLVQHTRSQRVRDEVEYWLAFERKDLRPFPVDFPGGVDSFGSIDWAAGWLDVEETQALTQDVLQAYDAQLDDVLLTALAQGFAPWTGSPALLVNLISHGRVPFAEDEDIDLSRTVGWLSIPCPFVVDLIDVPDPGAAVQRVKADLKGIPNRGLAYSILRFMSPDAIIQERLRALPRAEVVFNNVGDFVNERAVYRLAQWGPPHKEFDPESLRPYAFVIQVVFRANRLYLIFEYSTNMHQRSTAQALADRTIAALRAMVQHSHTL